MKNLLIILTILISSVGFSQTKGEPVDTIDTDFPEMVEGYLYQFNESIGMWVSYVEVPEIIEPEIVIDNEVVKAEFVRLLNEKRVKLGKSELTYLVELEKATDYHLEYVNKLEIKDTTSSYYHDETIDFEGFDEIVEFDDRIKKLSSIESDKSAEIVSGHWTTKTINNIELAESLFNNFCKSKSHYKIMVDESYNLFAVSVNSKFIVVNFIDSNYKLLSLK